MKPLILKYAGLGLLTSAVIGAVFMDVSNINILSMTFLAGCLYISGRILERKQHRSITV